MPLYEYECDACGRRFEVIRKFSDPPVETCELCEGGPVRRLQSAPAIQFKGSGFYITDYRSKSYKDRAKQDRGGSGGGSEGGGGSGSPGSSGGKGSPDSKGSSGGAKPGGSGSSSGA